MQQAEKIAGGFRFTSGEIRDAVATTTHQARWRGEEAPGLAVALVDPRVRFE